MKINFSAHKNIIVKFFGFLLLVSTFGFKALDDENWVTFFRNIEFDLDDAGIDIVQKWNSNIMLEGRPTLAPIANYQVSVIGKQNEWTEAFSSLYANAIVALKTKQTITAENFLSKWRITPAEKRIFISFTRDDLVHAEKIKRVLERKGYKVFLYTESHRAPFTSPKMIVDCMKSAGHVLVLDTENSRNKIGVIAEVLAFAKYTYKPENQIIDENKQLEQQIIEQANRIQFEKCTSDNIIKNTIAAYKKEVGVTLSNEDIEKKMQENYKMDLNDYLSGDFIRKGKEKYTQYLTNNMNLTPYAYNKKLTENLSLITDNLVVDFSLTSISSLVNFLTYFEFCPYYKIPIKLCPICSRYSNLIEINPIKQ